MPARRFPPPWSHSMNKTPALSCVTLAGQAISHVHFENELGRRSAVKLLSEG
jgi:hypothetical protein